MESISKGIMEELKEIKKGIEFLKANLPDKDMFLTREEETLLEESYENEKKGKLVSSGELIAKY